MSAEYGGPAIDGLVAWADEQRVLTRTQQGLEPASTDPVVAAEVVSRLGDWLDGQQDSGDGVSAA